MTSEEIIERLLKEDKISVKEAMHLMKDILINRFIKDDDTISIAKKKKLWLPGKDEDGSSVDVIIPSPKFPNQVVMYGVVNPAEPISVWRNSELKNND